MNLLNELLNEQKFQLEFEFVEVNNELLKSCLMRVRTDKELLTVTLGSGTSYTEAKKNALLYFGEMLALVCK